MQNKYIDPQNQKPPLRLRPEFEFWVFIYSENNVFSLHSQNHYFGGLMAARRYDLCA